MQQKPLADVLNEPDVRSTFEGLYEDHLKSIEMMRVRATCKDGVIEYDISDRNLEGQNKFIPYYLFPQAVYCVGVSLSPIRAKISVGSNPWNSRERTENLAKLCEQYGGGGHAVVAAISFKPDALEEARTAAARNCSQAASVPEKGVRSRDRDRTTGLSIPSGILDAPRHRRLFPLRT